MTDKPEFELHWDYMTTEIELKYLVLGATNTETITGIFEQKNIQFTYQEKLLENSYFDTPDLSLRQFDMGLRIRRDNEYREQTIKTAGQVVGGLHSRPEYNVDMEAYATNKFPILSLFPDEIWCAEQSVAAIQNDLIILFNTNFKRSTWLVIDQHKNQIEVAFDQGSINSGSESEQICELELELVSGVPEALFALAEVLFEELAIRPGIESKAARGYALYHGKLKQYCSESEFYICDLTTDSIASAFTLGLNLGLSDLQANVAGYLLSRSLTDLARIKGSLATIRHGFWLFEKHLTEQELVLRGELSHFIHLLAWVDNANNLQELTNKTGNYRKKLNFSEQLIDQLKIEKRRFPNTEEITEFLHSSRFNQLQLAILKMFLGRAQSATNGSGETRNDLKQFAQSKIQFSLGEISHEMKSSVNFNCEQYIAQSKLLYRSLLTGTWLSGLFDEEARDKFRHPWLDLQHGISELQSLWIIQQQLEKLSEPPEKLVRWQNSKVEGLLTALDNTKAMAIAMPPYWLESL
ncbi:CYTH domain-containing protein [Cognaticolwellia mytili]|uniref:CYTH domain-containing protein n=1 Tax=Cognaticolwellia mytili TaxID=1888913 RepID=UPI000A16E546|nr:CYTH domain-containing protein [Cognaticolwellia mytili]